VLPTTAKFRRVVPNDHSGAAKIVLDAFVGIDNVTVTGGTGSFTVTFGGTQSTTNMQQIFGDAANATNGSTTRTITTAYDSANQITSVSDPSSTINFTLDNLGRATTVAQSVNGLTPTVSLNQAFDAMNNRTELKATIASTLDFKNTYQFDKLQRLTDIVQQGQSGGNAVTAKHITQSFNALSQRTQIARYQSTGTTNAVATSDFTFDTANRLSGIAHKQGATNLNTYAYTYDPLSRIATIISTLDGTDTYSYDQTSQLVGATHTSQANETYGFDSNGNRNTTGFTTGTNNQTTAGLGFTYTFDDEGNRTKRTETATGKVQEYDWDHRNRLIAVKDKNTSAGAIVRQVNYQYDAFNRLVRRDHDADGAGAGTATSQYWIYDEGINAVLQFDGSSASNLSHRYLWSNHVDDLVADEQVTSLSTGGNALWGLKDHLSSIRDIADQNESTGVTTIANHRRNNSFGQLISESNASVDMIFAFTGKQYDEVTGLQHNLNRWYDPALGQWLSEDPIGFSAGDENVRRYVGNGPVKRTDPSGLWWWDDDWLELGVGGLLGLQGQEVQEVAGANIVSNPLFTAPGKISAIDPTPISGTVDTLLVGTFEGQSVTDMAVDIGMEVMPGPNPRKGKKVVGAIDDSIGSSVNRVAPSKTPVGSTRHIDLEHADNGGYKIEFESGMGYAGKGGTNRARQSARRRSQENNDPVKKIDHFPADNDKDAFDIEATFLQELGGHKSPRNYNQIDSPGTPL
jgi:RHS repeat-associated protein